MDWTAVVPVVASLAPMAGSILGGLLPFPGSSIIGQKFGEIIAKQFGLPATATPGQLSDAIATAGEETARAKINAALEQARIEIAGFVDLEKAYLHAVEVGLTQTNETMRAEIQDQRGWYHTLWRPSCGWLFVWFAFIYGMQLCYAAALSAFFGDGVPLKVLTDAWPAFLALMAPLALMVGVFIIGRTQEKVASVMLTPSVTAVASAAIKKK